MLAQEQTLVKSTRRRWRGYSRLATTTLRWIFKVRKLQLAV
jgi:hypothetical protein